MHRFSKQSHKLQHHHSFEQTTHWHKKLVFQCRKIRWNIGFPCKFMTSSSSVIRNGVNSHRAKLLKCKLQYHKTRHPTYWVQASIHRTRYLRMMSCDAPPPAAVSSLHKTQQTSHWWQKYIKLWHLTQELFVIFPCLCALCTCQI